MRIHPGQGPDLCVRVCSQTTSAADSASGLVVSAVEKRQPRLEESVQESVSICPLYKFDHLALALTEMWVVS